MIDTINKYASKGLYIGIYPICEKSGIQWVSYVMIAGERKWMKGEKGCTMSAFNSFENAYKSVIDYCEKYKGEKSNS